jgi:hypothetical protein
MAIMSTTLAVIVQAGNLSIRGKPISYIREVYTASKTGDYIELLVYQTNSGAVNVTSDSRVGITSLSVYKISE